MNRLPAYKFHLPLLLALLLTGVIVACGGAEEATEAPTATSAPAAAPTAAPTEAPAAQAEPTSPPAPSGASESVGKLTVAADAWGSDLLNSWEDTQPSFLRDYFATRLLGRDENMVISPLWATTWAQDENGILLTLHPDAACQNGEPMDAEALMLNLQGILGNIEGFSGSFLASSLDDLIDTNGYDIRGEREIYLGTDSPSPAGWAILHGANYHTIWFNPPDYLQDVGHEEYVRNPVGCGPYHLTEFNPGDSATFERWDDFWGDYPYYSPPQHEVLELVKVPEATTRFAQLTAGNVDMALGLPYPIAKDLDRSENGSQGAGFNPGNGGLWTQTLGANGKMQVAFDLEFALKELNEDGNPEGRSQRSLGQKIPTLNVRVREALAMAVDKQAIHWIRDSGSCFPTSQSAARVPSGGGIPRTL